MDSGTRSSVSALARWRWRPRCYLSFLVLWWSREIGTPPSLLLKLYGGIGLWLLSMALHRRGARLCSALVHADSTARRYLTDAIFPYYIVHQTAIILIAHELRGSDLPAWLEAGIVISGTIATCALTYEIVRRIPVLQAAVRIAGLAFEPAATARRDRDQPAQ